MLDPSLIRQAAAGIVPPALVAVGTLLGARALWRAAPGVPRWSIPLAIGLGTFASFVATHGWPGDPRSADVKEALAWGALVLAAIGALSDRSLLDGARRTAPLALALRAALSFGLCWYTLDFMRGFHWRGLAAWGWCGGLGAAAFLVALALQPLVRRRSGEAQHELTLGWCLASALAGGALLAGRSASLAQLAGGLAAALGGLALVQWRARAAFPGGGALTTFVLLHQGLLWAGHFAAELTAPSAILAGLAPLGAWLGELGPARPGARRWLSWLGVGLLAGAALGLAGAGPAEPPYAASR